jgi:hypothetical protein
MAYIKVRPFGMERFVEGRTQGFRLRFEVIEAVGVDPNIFVYEIKNRPGYTSKDFFFQNIASPSDIEEYPAGQPEDINAVGISPFFRLSEADLIFRSAQAVGEALEKVKQDLLGLIESIEWMEHLVALPEIEVGTAPSSSSSSPSSSA